MTVTIIEQDGCPMCEKAISEFMENGDDIFIYKDLSEIKDTNLRNDLMTDLMMKNGDMTIRPIIFVNDKYTKWTPKGF